MKNLFLKFAMLCFVLSPAMLVSCSDDDNGGDGGDGGSGDSGQTEIGALTSDEKLYSEWVAEDLYLSSLRLVANWGGETTAEQDQWLEDEDYSPVEDYGQSFIEAGLGGNTKYPTVASATTTIIAGCRDIIDEVAHSKIGAPYDGSDVNYIESPHSYNSIQDFYDNTLGCLYALNGAVGAETPSENSLMKYALEKYPTEATSVNNAISNALAKIKQMKSPFVLYYADRSAGEAIAALEKLDEVLANLSNRFGDHDDEATLRLINKNYVENVVRPTYETLAVKSKKLFETFENLSSQEDLDLACNTWKEARQYWEWSEAFLFGPAHNFSIDPHIDTWPFDVSAFNRYIKNNSPLTDATNKAIVTDAIRNGQNLTGFHAIEYLIFRNGQNRKF